MVGDAYALQNGFAARIYQPVVHGTGVGVCFEGHLGIPDDFIAGFWNREENTSVSQLCFFICQQLRLYSGKDYIFRVTH